jgi:hypothetical protein
MPPAAKRARSSLPATPTGSPSAAAADAGHAVRGTKDAVFELCVGGRSVTAVDLPHTKLRSSSDL